MAASLLVVYMLFCVVYSECNDDKWCTTDGSTPENVYISYLAAITFGLCVFLIFDKRLIVMVLCWFGTMMSFIYITDSLAFLYWNIIVLFDLLLYVILFHSIPIDPFGDTLLYEYFKDIAKRNILLKKEENKHKLMAEKKRLLEKAKQISKQQNAMNNNNNNNNERSFFGRIFESKQENETIQYR